MEFYYHGTDRDVMILSADGGLSRHNVAQFLEELETLVDSGIRKMIVDCTRLTYISSFGVGALAALKTRLAKRGGEVKLASVKSLILNVLRTTNLDRVFEIYPDVEAARQAFRAGG